MTIAQPLPAFQRRIITVCVMTATLMVSLDTTIANVALPHMQGSLSASQDEISWVLTSYIVAGAICTPLTGWLAARFGQRRTMLVSIIGFTVTSALCGVAMSLPEMVAFRLLQGMSGAALVPISQAVLLDINPPERHGPAMAIWGMGALVGPIVGPALGGWLTENASWHWVFYINVPLGAACALGVSAFMQDHEARTEQRFDRFGFATLALAIAAFQLMLDRGQQLDWFSSPEICIEAAGAALFLYLFTVHTLTTDHPFVDLGLFKDRNFFSACIFGLFLGVVMYAVLALLPPMLSHLFGYPVVLIGLVTAPRGFGTIAAMFLAGGLARRLDPRVPLLGGLILCCISADMMTGYSLEMTARPVILAGVVQGVGAGLMFLSMSTLAFATVAPDRRNEAAAIFTLIRNLGGAVGIAGLQAITIRNTAVVRARLVEGVRPDNPILQLNAPDTDFGLAGGLATLSAEVSRQAAMVSYVDSFHALLVISIAVLPLLLYARPHRATPDQAAAPTPVHLD